MVRKPAGLERKRVCVDDSDEEVPEGLGPRACGVRPTVQGVGNHAFLGFEVTRVCVDDSDAKVQGYLAHKKQPFPVGPYSSPMPRDL